MGIRHAVAESLERAIGPERTQKLRSTEASARQKLIDALDLEHDRVSRKQAGAERRAAVKRAVQEERKAAARRKAAKPKPTREELIEAHGASREGISHPGKGALPWASPDPSADFPKPTVTKHELLASLHAALQPRTYFEIGVDRGQSMTLSRTKSIGVDPAFRIDREISCDVRIVKDTSDHFFETTDLFDTHFDGVPVDLAFIDGMHLAEFALRDFMNTEKKMAPTGVIALDDILPRNSLEAFRQRRTEAWAGDVYKVHEVLARYRPDLTLIPVNTTLTGSYLVVGLDPTSTVLDDNYEQIEAEITGADPQAVPQEWLERRTAVDPVTLLDHEVWKRLSVLRESGSAGSDLSELWSDLRGLPSIYEPTGVVR
ncbi:class I SAM-dependent methyltransferase [Nocardioides sp. CCNWLW239]|uniref:class I SAM-dependent methyltransferase n=1 Tax=Nocardioides sp. CCNWLW239 TaxID=3128902 RepID=UPI00301A2611